MNQLTEEVLARLDALAAKLGVSVERLWEILVSQAYLSGIFHLCSIGIAVVLCLALVRFTRRLAPDATDDVITRLEQEETFFVCRVVSYTVLGAVLALSVCFLNHAMTEILNPQYHAWREISEVLR